MEALAAMDEMAAPALAATIVDPGGATTRDDTLARDGAAEACLRQGRVGAEKLLELLSHPDPDTRLVAVRKLASRADLEKGLREAESSSATRAEAFVLGRFQTAILLLSLEDPDERIRKEAVAALSAMGQFGIETLSDALHGDAEHAERHRVAAQALKDMGPDAAEVVACRLLADKDAAASRRAGQLLKSMGDVGVTAAARRLRDARDPVSRWRAADILRDADRCIASSFQKELVNAQADECRWVRVAASRALAQHGLAGNADPACERPASTGFLAPSKGCLPSARRRPRSSWNTSESLRQSGKRTVFIY
eukprot:TRINITY_DN20260_c0_g1_i3.p1 TRINITY_DN20260_c0_g1~~TRINITY_DN20260_c0_g1_i3.p1  ORF type:complete len:310 (-),score=61.05 TRINITY_DN20260_c0_g1_i3:68-997(-)